MYVKSVSLSDDVIAWIEEQQKARKTSFSNCLDSIVREQRQLSPAILKQEALVKLRAATSCLFNDCNIPAEAILSWVRAIVEVQGGEKID